MVDIAAAVMNTTAADASKIVGSNTTSGCGSHVPGRVYTDGCDAKIISPPM